MPIHLVKALHQFLRLAAEFVYLAINPDGHWYKPKLALQSILAFLYVQTKVRSSAADVEALRTLVKAPPDAAKIEKWFNQTFRR